MSIPKTIVFIDGENLVFRYQAMVAEGRKPSPKIVHIPDVFVWHPGITDWCYMNIIRVYFYTSVVGDDQRLSGIKKQIADTHYSFEFAKNDFGTAQIVPMVFKKLSNTRKSRQVDINIAIDMMRFAYQQSIDLLYLVSGDGDYLPLISEVMHNGKELYVAALSSGLKSELRDSVDDFHDLDNVLFKSHPRRKPAN